MLFHLFLSLALLIHIPPLKGVSVEQGSEVSSTSTVLSQGYKILEYPGASLPKTCVAFEPWTDKFLIICLW